jgi:hypothetical protein
MEEADASLLRAEAALRRLAVPAPGGDCASAADLLMGALAAAPLAPGLERNLQLSASGDGVVLSLAVEGEVEPRQRLFLPAALGLCGTAAAEADQTQPPVPPLEEGDAGTL